MIELKTSLKDIKKENPQMCYYSALTPWWTHRSSDLRRGPVPLDKYGSVLYETDRTADFLDEKRIKECGQYGKYPIETFMITHNDNISILEKFVSVVDGQYDWKALNGMEGISKIVEKIIEKGGK